MGRDPAACSSGLLRLLQAKLKPLDYIVRMRDLGRVTNAVQLQVNYVRLCASQIPNHWSRLTPPEVGAAAFNYCDAAISSAIAIILHTADSPTDRATLALTRCCLSSRGGGLGTADYSRRSPSNYTSAFISAWPASCSACPALSSIAISPTSTSPAIVSFCTAYEHVSSTLASVRDRHSALDPTIVLNSEAESVQLPAESGCSSHHIGNRRCSPSPSVALRWR